MFFHNAEIYPPTSCTKSELQFKITHQKRHCGDPRKLETFFSTLCSNFRTHNHHFPGGDTDKVQYALDHHGSWVDHPDHTKQMTSMTDTDFWGHDLLANDDRCLSGYDLFITEIWKQYGAKDCKQNSSTWVHHEMMEGFYNSDDNIIARFSVAELRIKLHFRPGSWNFWH